MARTIDIASWKRRQHFEFFRHYEQPFWSLCAEVDVSRLLRLCLQPQGPSYFLASFYLSLVAANET